MNVEKLLRVWGRMPEPHDFKTLVVLALVLEIPRHIEDGGKN